MQTILGSGGAIGTELAKALSTYSDKIRLVSRNPKKVNSTDELVSADLTDPESTKQAVSGSSVVYLTVGLPYELKTWRTVWPLLLENVIEACKLHDARLVFFDNIYMYDPESLDGMTEKTPLNPSSEKGKVREKLHRMIFDEVEAENLTALIARCADYYGPSIQQTSLLTETVFKNLANGNRAVWMGSADYKHSFTYTPDAGRATALLGNSRDAFNQVWHLPTASNPPTGKEWISLIAKEMEVEPKYFVMSNWMIKIAGWFVPLMRELSEMVYQFDRDYVFDSHKFEERFDFRPTPYQEGVKEVVAADYQNRK